MAIKYRCEYLKFQPKKGDSLPGLLQEELQKFGDEDWSLVYMAKMHWPNTIAFLCVFTQNIENIEIDLTDHFKAVRESIGLVTDDKV